MPPVFPCRVSQYSTTLDGGNSTVENEVLYLQSGSHVSIPVPAVPEDAIIERPEEDDPDERISCK